MEPTEPTQSQTDRARLDTVTISTPSFSTGAFATDELIAGRFRIVKKIAEGGMGVVYLAVDEKLKQPRALKVPKFDYVSHLPPEVRSALSVTHPNVCRVYEIHTAQTPLGVVDFLSMEFIDGGSLSSHLSKHGPMAGAEALSVAEQICAGLEACHEKGLLHRDLKANNVLLTRSAEGELRAAVTDFGIAVDSTVGPGDLAGTPAYLAPEVWQGKPASVASDIFALGLVLHEIIAGKLPSGNKEEPRKLAPGIPKRWAGVISRCLAADPAKRYATPTAVAEVLSGRVSRRRALWASAAMVVLASLAAWRILNPVTPPSHLAVLAVEAPGADASLASLARGVSYDLSSRLVRYRPRPPQLVIIPVDETQGLTPKQSVLAKQRLGASHILRAVLLPAGKGLLLRASIVDTTSQVVLRETSAELASASEVSPRLAALVAAAFNLPRQTGAETVNASAYAEYAKGLSLLRLRSDYVQAVTAFARAVAQDPGSALAHARLAEACALAWDRSSDPQWLTRGRAAVAQATALSPDSPSVHLAAGALSRAGGENDRAVDEYKRAIQLDPSSAEGWNGLAAAYQAMQGRRADAAEAYLKAIELQPGYSAPLNNFAVFQRSMGNYDEAEKLWLRAVALVPESPLMHANLGGHYVDRNRPEDAERELLRAVSLDPAFRTPLNNLGALYQYQGRDADAVSVLEKARALGQESYTLALNLGDCYRRLGNQAAARLAYQRGQKLTESRLGANPADAVTRAFLAYFLLRLADRANGDKEMNQALHFGAKDRAVIRRAVIYFEASGRRPKALELLQAATPDLLAELNRQPDLTGLRKDPQFQALVPASK